MRHHLLRRLLVLLAALQLLLGLRSQRAAAARAPGQQEWFSEQLRIQPLGNSSSPASWLAQFEFRLQSGTREPLLVPQQLLELASSDIQLALTRGRWLEHLWGQQESQLSRPPGAQLMLRFDNTDAHGSTENDLWSAETSRLSKLFCAALHSEQHQRSGPGLRLSPEDLPVVRLPSGGCGGGPWQMKLLPQEPVCVENLGRWLQLLPCRGKVGLASLIRPGYVQARYQSLEFDWRREPGHTVAATLRLTFVMGSTLAHTFLLDPLRTGGALRACSVCHRSHWAVFPAADDSEAVVVEQGFLRKPVETTATAVLQPPVRSSDPVMWVRQWAAGTGRREGSWHVSVELLNHPMVSAASSLRILMELPNAFHPLLHTLALYTKGGIHTIGFRLNGGSEDDSVSLASVWWRPQSRAAVLLLNIPLAEIRGGDLQVSLHFLKNFLHASEFPPDISRGLEIPSCAVVLLGSSSEEALARVYGAPIVVQVPFPDQSMPFNVIAFTLTAVAFFAGSLLNISTARTQDIVRRLMARSDETKKNVVASVNGEAADLTKAEQLALHSEQ